MAKSKFIHGEEAVEEAFFEAIPLQKILILKDHPIQDDELWQQIKQSGVPIQEVPYQKLRREGAKKDTKVIAEKAPIAYYESSDLVTSLFEEGRTPRLAFLDGITDVRNLGAIARSALCFDFHGLIIPHKNSAMVTHDAIHTSSGALEFLPVCREPTISHAIQKLKSYGLLINACSEKGEENVMRANFTNPSGLVFGSEEKGISSAVLKQCDGHYFIPMSGPVGSLNVSVAAAVCFYEALRQNHS